MIKILNNEVDLTDWLYTRFLLSVYEYSLHATVLCVSHESVCELCVKCFCEFPCLWKNYKMCMKHYEMVMKHSLQAPYFRY